VLLAFHPKSCAVCAALSWKFATHCEAFSGSIAHATPLTESLTTFHAHVATFSAAHVAH